MKGLSLGLGLTKPLPWYSRGAIGGVNPSLWLDYFNDRYAVNQAPKTFSGSQTFTRDSTATGTSSLSLIVGYLSNEERLEYSTGIRGLLMEEARTNLLKDSEDFTTANWPQNTATVTANQAIAPDGTMTADKVVCSGTQRIRQAVTGLANPSDVAPSIYIRADAPTTVTMRAGSTIGSYVVNVTTEWQRAEVTAGSNEANFLNFDVEGVDNTFYVWGGQFELGLFHTSYNPTAGSAVERKKDKNYIDGTTFSSTYNQAANTTYIEGVWLGGATYFWIDKGDSGAYTIVIINASGTVGATNQEAAGDGGAYDSGNSAGTLTIGQHFKIALVTNGTSNRLYLNGAGDTASNFTTSTVYNGMTRFIYANTWNFGVAGNVALYAHRSYPTDITEAEGEELTTPDLSTLLDQTTLWLDAADTDTITETAGAVSQWDDKSGNGNDATQSTGANQPITGTDTIGGLNALTGAYSKFMDLTTGITSFDYTYFIVNEVTNTTGIKTLLAGAAGSPSIRYSSAETVDIVRTAEAVILSGTPPVSGTSVLVGITSNGDNRVYNSGGTVLDSNTANPAYTQPLTRIGANEGGASSFIGKLGQIIVFDRVLNDSELNVMGNYLADKWGITWTDI